MLYIDNVISRLKANVSKSVEIVFSEISVEDGRKCGGHKLRSYTIVDFTCNGARDLGMRI